MQQMQQQILYLKILYFLSMLLAFLQGKNGSYAQLPVMIVYGLIDFL